MCSHLARLLQKIEKAPGPLDTRCWIWTAATKPNRRGEHYGTFWYQGQARPAHRVSLILTGVKVPDHMVVAHRCDQTLCVRPEHLSVVTQKQNVADMWEKGRAWFMGVSQDEGRFQNGAEARAYYDSLLNDDDLGEIPF